MDSIPFDLKYELLASDRLIILHKPDSIWLQIIDALQHTLGLTARLALCHLGKVLSVMRPRYA